MSDVGCRMSDVGCRMSECGIGRRLVCVAGATGMEEGERGERAKVPKGQRKVVREGGLRRSVEWPRANGLFTYQRKGRTNSECGLKGGAWFVSLARQGWRKGRGVRALDQTLHVWQRAGAPVRGGGRGEFEIRNSKFEIRNSKFRNAECGMRNAEWGMQRRAHPWPLPRGGGGVGSGGLIALVEVAACYFVLAVAAARSAIKAVSSVFWRAWVAAARSFFSGLGAIAFHLV